MECDDEYWFDENGELVFAQPAGLPSNIVAFNCRIQLSSIHAEAYRRMVGVNSHIIEAYIPNTINAVSLTWVKS